MSKKSSRIIKLIILNGVFTFLLSMFVYPVYAQDSDLTGLWLTKKKDTVVKIEQCGDSLCGKIHWLAHDVVQKDSANPDKSLRERSLCGIEVLWGFEQNENNPDLWEYGKIYKADDGKIFNASLRLISKDKLKLRGYIGLPVFGKSHILSRTIQDEYQACQETKENL